MILGKNQITYVILTSAQFNVNKYDNIPNVKLTGPDVCAIVWPSIFHDSVAPCFSSRSFSGLLLIAMCIFSVSAVSILSVLQGFKNGLNLWFTSTASQVSETEVDRSVGVYIQ